MSKGGKRHSAKLAKPFYTYSQQKQARQALEDALLQGVHSDPAAPLTDADWEQMRQDIPARAETPHQ